MLAASPRHRQQPAARLHAAVPTGGSSTATISVEAPSLAMILLTFLPGLLLSLPPRSAAWVRRREPGDIAPDRPDALPRARRSTPSWPSSALFALAGRRDALRHAGAARGRALGGLAFDSLVASGGRYRSRAASLAHRCWRSPPISSCGAGSPRPLFPDMFARSRIDAGIVDVVDARQNRPYGRSTRRCARADPHARLSRQARALHPCRRARQRSPSPSYFLARQSMARRQFAAKRPDLDSHAARRDRLRHRRLALYEVQPR